MDIRLMGTLLMIIIWSISYKPYNNHHKKELRIEEIKRDTFFNTLEKNTEYLIKHHKLKVVHNNTENEKDDELNITRAIGIISSLSQNN